MMYHNILYSKAGAHPEMEPEGPKEPQLEFQGTPASMPEHACTHTRIHAYTHSCIHTYIHIFIHTCIHTFMHTYIHSYIHTFMHTSRHVKPSNPATARAPN